MEDLTCVSEFSTCIQSCKMKRRWKLWVHGLICPSWERHMKFVIPMFLLLLFPFVVVQSWLFVTPWTAACQASLSSTISWSLLKLESIEVMMPSNPLILCHPLLLLPWIFPRIRVFSNESALCIRWPQYWSFIFDISPSLQRTKKLLIFHSF